MTGKQQHFYKPHKPQRIATDPKWTNLMFTIGGVPRRRFYADADGRLDARLYLPLELPSDGRMLRVRVRLVRDAFKGKPIDPTAYDERYLPPSGDRFARLSFVYSGRAEKGRRYFWQAQILGGGPGRVATTGTHYADFWRSAGA